MKYLIFILALFMTGCAGLSEKVSDARADFDEKLQEVRERNDERVKRLEEAREKLDEIKETIDNIP